MWGIPRLRWIISYRLQKQTETVITGPQQPSLVSLLTATLRANSNHKHLCRHRGAARLWTWRQALLLMPSRGKGPEQAACRCRDLAAVVTNSLCGRTKAGSQKSAVCACICEASLLIVSSRLYKRRQTKSWVDVCLHHNLLPEQERKVCDTKWICADN